MEARPWDFQAEEFALQGSINKFHQRRYEGKMLLLSTLGTNWIENNNEASPNQSSNILGELATDLNNILLNEPEDLATVLNRPYALPKTFIDNYEFWLKEEVLGRNIDWDCLLQSDSPMPS